MSQIQMDRNLGRFAGRDRQLPRLDLHAAPARDGKAGDFNRMRRPVADRDFAAKVLFLPDFAQIQNAGINRQSRDDLGSRVVAA